MNKNNIKRIYYMDRYNNNKIWQVSILKGGYYLRQYIKGIQFGRGLKCSKKFITSIGILDYEKINVINE